MKPYYHDPEAGIVIYHGDARDVLPDIADPLVLITDPPYGVDLGIDKDMRGGSHGLAKERYASYEDTYEQFCAVVVPIIRECAERCVRGAVFSGPHLQDLPKADAVGGVYCPAGSGRHRWGFKTFLPVLFYGTDPRLQFGAKPNTIVSSAVAERNGHPCPKPIEWMRWLVERATLQHETVIDPFMGSGTTLRAAKDLGRKAIGIELEERYCEIAAKRLSQSVMQLEVA